MTMCAVFWQILGLIICGSLIERVYNDSLSVTFQNDAVSNLLTDLTSYYFAVRLIERVYNDCLAVTLRRTHTFALAIVSLLHVRPAAEIEAIECTFQE